MTVHSKQWGAVVLALVLLAAGFFTISDVAHKAQGAATQATRALAGFEQLSTERRKENLANLAQIRRTATANHRQALRNAQLSRRLAVVAKQRANDAATAAAAQARLTQANAAAIADLANANRQIRALQMVQAGQARAACVSQRTQLRSLVLSFAGPHPPPQIRQVLKHIDRLRCPS